jgi:hypothetical protein
MKTIVDLERNGNLFPTTGSSEILQDNTYHLAHMIALPGPTLRGFLERTRRDRVCGVGLMRMVRVLESHSCDLQVSYSSIWRQESGEGLQRFRRSWRKRENGMKLFSSFMTKMLKWKPEEGVTRKTYWMIDDSWLNSV